MAQSATQIATDLDSIWTDLAATACTETGTFYQPNGTTEIGTATVLRGRQLKGQELEHTGWGVDYEFSVYVITSEDPGGVVDGLLNLADGDFGILNISKGPLTLYTRFDLGGKFNET